MFVSSNVANGSPPVPDHVVETRSDQGSPHVGVASRHEYSLHERVPVSVKLLPRHGYIPVGRRLRHCRRNVLYVGTWNVRSLVETSGDCRVCCSRRVAYGNTGVERKLDLLVKELARYRISIAGIQETKWFGSDIWPAGEWTFLHSGRILPADDDITIRREGVGILLDGRATAAWRAAGEMWTAVSSRIVTARLKLASAGQRLVGGLRRSSDVYLTVVSVYAPTFCAPGDIVKHFYDELQDTLNRISSSDLLLVLGDLNTRVGLRSRDSDVWSSVLGHFGIDDINQAGEDLLSFCDLNQLSLMNTWFKKRDNLFGTWTHPATKQCSMIDFVMFRSAQRRHCLDVQVMRGATCWTDHKLVRAKLRLDLCCTRRRNGRKLAPIDVERFADPLIQQSFCSDVSEGLREVNLAGELGASSAWDRIRECLLSSAVKAVGRRRRRQPDWFVMGEHLLSPLLAAKNEAWNGVLRSDSPACRRRFRQCERDVKRAVTKAKEDWIQRTALAANDDGDGRGRWRCVKQLQMVSRGRQPTRTSAVLDEDGLLLSDPDAVTARWCRHFTKVLNVVSVFSPVGIDRMPTLEMRRDLNDPPTSEEFQRALSKLRLRKAGGDSGVLPEMLVFGGPVLHTVLLDLFQRVWREGQVFAAWRDALVVPVPKKGDLTMCDNWRGISLLDVAGKLLGRIVQERLQCIAESVLPDSQCGFRRGRGCSDMIFVARQLVEKAREHNSLLFVLFVDLKKAFDSVPRDALWQVLERFGVPPVLLAMIRSFHVDMRAAVTVKGRYSDSFAVKNGVRQGCTIAPVLFNLYLCAVVDDWRK